MEGYFPETSFVALKATGSGAFPPAKGTGHSHDHGRARDWHRPLGNYAILRRDAHCAPRQLPVPTGTSKWESLGGAIKTANASTRDPGDAAAEMPTCQR
jgi:hypothetical protein